MATYRPQIFQSTINALLDKVQRKNYSKYLLGIKLTKVRGFVDQRITFDFPVTAHIGPNGGGKTTVLGAAACAYKSTKPGRFFPKSGSLDESMRDWTIEYDLIDRSRNPRDPIKRTASYRKSKWYRKAEDRNVPLFGVARTVPAPERVELKKCASNTFVVAPYALRTLAADVAKSVSKILAKDVSQYTHFHIDTRGRVSMLAAKTNDGTEYSEFHFGAGESSVIRMLMEIEAAPDGSLILIEEIENGLHPIATIRMVEYLIETAERKNAQAIFTTHSQQALLPLPDPAVWAAIDGRLYHGHLDIESLRALTPEFDPQLVIFVEDKFSKTWLENILRAGDVPLDMIEIYPVEGDGRAVLFNRMHKENPSITTPSICIIDGDSQQVESGAERVFRLPGGVPEGYVYDKVMEVFDRCGGQLTTALLRPYDAHPEVQAILQEVQRTVRDDHNLYKEAGFRNQLIPEETVKGAFTYIWSLYFPGEVEEFLNPIKAALPQLAQREGDASEPQQAMPL